MRLMTYRQDIIRLHAQVILDYPLHGWWPIPISSANDIVNLFELGLKHVHDVRNVCCRYHAQKA